MIVMAALILVLQSAAPFEQSQQAQNAKASIEGFVVRAGTNEPVARARVTVFRTAGPGGSPTVLRVRRTANALRGGPERR